MEMVYYMLNGLNTLPDIERKERLEEMKNKLKEIRKSKGMTQEELAEKSGVSRGTIVALENNEGKVVTKTSTLLKLAAVLGCAVSDIFFS